VECIANAGRVVKTVEEYSEELRKLMENKEYYFQKSEAAKKRFLEKYELNGQVKIFANIYRDIVKNPYPHKLKRFFSSLHYTQNIRVFLAWVYLKLKYKFGIDLLKRK